MNATEVDAPALPANFDREMTRGGWALRPLSDKSGVDKNTLSSWRRGRSRVRIATVNKVAKAMGVKPAVLLGSTRAVPTAPAAPTTPPVPDPRSEVVRELAALAPELSRLVESATPDLLTALRRAASLAERSEKL